MRGSRPRTTIVGMCQFSPSVVAGLDPATHAIPRAGITACSQ